MSHSQITSRPMFSLMELLRVIAVALGAGLLLGIIGPFGTYEGMAPLQRFGFWIGAVAIGTFIHLPMFYGAALLAQFYRLPAWIWVCASAIVAALPMTFVINGISATLFRGIPLDGILELYPLVLVISLPMQWVSYLTSDFILPKGTPLPLKEEPTEAPKDPFVATLNAAPSQKAVAFSARLPARLGKALVCLEMEDHYVRVHTALGDTMIHMRMADAALELEGIEGMLVHRSYWVARDAITGWSRDGKTLTLQLSNGKAVPVARDRQPLVRAAGWLE